MFHFLRMYAWISVFPAVFYQVKAQKKSGPEISFLNVDKVWQQNKVTGRNIVVAVLDDGVSYTHKDLTKNYVKNAGYDFVDNDNDASPVFESWPWTSHGTKCAGVIAAKRNGGCRTGIAYNAKVTGIRIFSKSPHGADRTADGLAHNKKKIDIYSCSWGPTDNGYSTKGPGVAGEKALKDGALEGRNRKGSIFVFSSGNGGLFGDSCAFDGYMNNIYTIAIGAVTKTGTVPRYAESCSSVIASTYGDDVKTCDVFNSCNSNFGKTSSAASFASGIVALLLEANNKLTWRDVQHLIIRTSNPEKTKIRRDDWIVNGAGLMVHPSVGFGVMDAKKLVDVAEKWTTSVPTQLTCSMKWVGLTKTIRNRNGVEVPFSLPFERFKGCSSIKFMEHVKVEVSLSFTPRANLLMYMISPVGTKSQLLYQRLLDAITQRREYKGLVVTSLHFWGENPMGIWKVLFKAANFRRASQVRIDKLRFTFYGTAKDPLSQNTVLPKGLVAFGSKKIWKGYESTCGSSSTYDTSRFTCCPRINKIVEKRPLCGNRVYNKCNQLCCNGRLINQATHICCGGKTYSTFVCRKSRSLGWYTGRYDHDVTCPDGTKLKYILRRPPKRCILRRTG